MLNLDRPRGSRIIGLKEVILRTHLSKTGVYRMMGLGLFPAQAKKLNGSCTAGWFEDDVDAWIEDRRPDTARADQPKGADHTSQPEVQKAVPRLRGHSIAAIDRHRPKPPNAQDTDLVPMGISFFGRVVYLHRHTKQLLLDVGKLDSLPELGVLLEGRAAQKTK